MGETEPTLRIERECDGRALLLGAAALVPCLALAASLVPAYGPAVAADPLVAFRPFALVALAVPVGVYTAADLFWRARRPLGRAALGGAIAGALTALVVLVFFWVRGWLADVGLGQAAATTLGVVVVIAAQTVAGAVRGVWRERRHASTPERSRPAP